MAVMGCLPQEWYHTNESFAEGGTDVMAELRNKPVLCLEPIFSGPFCAYHILGKRKWWNGFDNIWRECTGATWKNCERQRYSWSPSLFSPRPNVPSVRTLAVPPQVRCEVVVLRLNVILWSVAISTEFQSHCSAWCQSSCITWITCKEVQNQFDVLKSGNKLSPISWVDLIKSIKWSRLQNQLCRLKMPLQLHQSPCGNTWSEGKFKSRTDSWSLTEPMPHRLGEPAHTTWYSCEVSLGVSWMCSDYWLWYLCIRLSGTSNPPKLRELFHNSWPFIPSEIQTLLLTASALWIDAVKGGIEIWQEQECRWKRAKAVPANRQAHKKSTTI